jgi:uncharacterized protein (DUF305 family)
VLVARAAMAQEHDHDHMSHHDHPAPTQGAAASTSALYTDDDLSFLTHMIMHHQQALDMCALVPSRSDREQFNRFARYLDGAQRAEIDQMNALLKEASDRGIQAPHHEMTGDPPMAGMLSKAQMLELAASKGAKFERLWLQGMIYHHQGAVDMSLAQQERDFRTHRDPYGIEVMVDDILSSQRAEIAKMQGWLSEWGLTSSGASH